MHTLKYKIDFYSYWHIGSGISGGTYADSTVLKDTNGLPYIPGRTIKGLFREAANSIAYFDNNFEFDQVEKIFGSPGTHLSLQSSSFFSDAKVSRAFAEVVLETKDFPLKDALFQVISSTQIEHESGTAAKGSLRQLEVTVPLTLFGSISLENPVNDVLITRSGSWIKSLGLNRTRGLGRCSISFTFNSPQ
ncbi:RAMP superfamily CRISPR-associated protein [Algoriphagus chordae]|uniref:CRISPR/Cas system CSM-associated protein Csm3 (Group 7 of RAMP superfamily) n=1 Tax=Algoriphagus chordae TaxID=237019 RepID=A0A2W7QQI4_9BACT|nr:RAMP superfamily CRISPR-associated protein [Algoriphagus chordae]PZX48290.1 CRISPR/Cas system CSM-associated protein Csm3 (group 7 of RAMP superfamily) [Algoriphagus chordae]